MRRLFFGNVIAVRGNDIQVDSFLDSAVSEAEAVGAWVARMKTMYPDHKIDSLAAHDITEDAIDFVKSQEPSA